MNSKTDIVINYIKDNLNNGKWKTGDKLLSEVDLAKKLNVSRNTVREALSILNNNGLITKRHGSGNYFTENAFSNRDKYIVIAVREEILLDLLGSVYRVLLELLKEAIVRAGYKPYVYMEQHKTNRNTEDILKAIEIDRKDIVGIVVLLFRQLDISDNNIPVVSCLGYTPCGAYNVIIDSQRYTTAFEHLINKYKLKKFIIVSSETLFQECKNIFAIIPYLMPRYLTRDHGEVIYIPWYKDFEAAPRMLKEKLASIDYIPDALIFIDDIILDATSKCFKDIKDILTKTKIIAHSNKEKKDPIDFKYCKVELTLKDIADNSISILEKVIKKEFITHPNVLLAPEIVNEEVLKVKV